MLRLCVTGDWRLLKDKDFASATQLELIVHAHALTESVNDGALERHLEKVKPKIQPDYTRMALEDNFTVDQGHTFAANSVKESLKMSLPLWRRLAYQADQGHLGQMAERAAGSSRQTSGRPGSADQCPRCWHIGGVPSAAFDACTLSNALLSGLALWCG